MMQAEPGDRLGTCWLMFAATGPGMSATAIKDAKMPATFADDSRMLRLIEMATSESDSTMDLTVIAIAALRDRRKRRQLQGRTSTSWKLTRGRDPRSSSEGSASKKTAPSKFSVLHSLEQSSQQVEADLREVAGRFGVNREELGFTSTAVEVGRGRLGPQRSTRRSPSPTARCATTSRSSTAAPRRST